ncbi:MAG TPA: hypothetical protein VFE59_32315 [Trebonia sp.]|nr:hypothetical protein [Trebonia sp.]
MAAVWFEPQSDLVAAGGAVPRDHAGEPAEPGRIASTASPPGRSVTGAAPSRVAGRSAGSVPAVPGAR